MGLDTILLENNRNGAGSEKSNIYLDYNEFKGEQTAEVIFLMGKRKMRSSHSIFELGFNENYQIKMVTR